MKTTNKKIQTVGKNELCGVWKNDSLFPTLLIFRDDAKYKLAVLVTDSLGQVKPEIHILELKSENDYCASFTYWGGHIKYNRTNDTLYHPGFGNYYRSIH